MKKFLAAALILVGLSLTGCGGSNSPNFYTGPTGFFTPTPTPAPTTEVNFNPSAGSLSDIPFPNDITRNPATGQNDLPASSATSEPQASFNSLSGFSTSGNITIPFVGLIDPNTVTPQTVIFLDATASKVANVNLSVTTDGEGNSIITGTPVTPLTPGHEYVGIVTDGVETNGDAPLTPNSTVLLTQSTTSLVDANGNSLVSGLTNTEAQELEAIRESLQPAYAAASEATSLNVNQLYEVFTFQTQTLFGTLQNLHTAALATPPSPTIETPLATLSPPPPATTPSPGAPSPTPIVLPNPLTQTSAFLTIPTFINSVDPGAPSSHIGTILFGSYADPNYQGTPPAGSATGFFAAGSGPAGLQQFGSNDISFIVCLPANATTTVSPVPCVIFQHGITRTNFDVFAIADTICATGQGVIAINLVLHGDRAIPDQPSGTDFINLTSLRSSRDNIRQSVSDQDNLLSMILAGNTNFLGTGKVFNTGAVSYLGQSLGSIVGTDFTATNAQCITSILNVPGARILNLLLNSPTFQTPIEDALDPVVGAPGTPAFNQFVQIADTIIDDSDPFNYGPHLLHRDLASNAAVGVLMQEMIGDQVIPNSAFDDLGLATDITQVNALQVISTPTNCVDPFTLPQQTITAGSGFVGSGVYQYSGGQHGFLLDPSEGGTSGIDTVEGQEQVAAYLSTAVGNNGIGTIILPPAARQGAVVGNGYSVNARALFGQ